MLCVYFEIPYEQQLARIAPNKIQTILNTITQTAESNGATAYKIPCASIYRFSDNEAAPVFSVSLFLQFLADMLRTHKQRILDYRVIIDCCKETDSDDTVTDHFATYKSLLIPSRGFFASNQAERLLRSYISFDYISKCRLYHCTNFIIPKSSGIEPTEQAYKIYFSTGRSQFWSIYHFMLRHPLTDQRITERLSENEKKQYTEAKNALHYFRKNRFCSEYPEYFTDAFLLYTQVYFHAFIKIHHNAELSIVYTDETASDTGLLVKLIPFAHTELLPKKQRSIDGLSIDFIQLAYLALYASAFIFEDEIQDFFMSLHKSATFVTGLYEWMYAAGIIEIKNDIHSVHKETVDLLEQRLGPEKEHVKPYIAAFLWDKYKKGELCPDDGLKNIFADLHFTPADDFLLHYFFHKYSDAEIPQVNISPFKQTGFFSALESYRKALTLDTQHHTGETVYAIKNAIGAVQKPIFPAGEYRALSRSAFLYLSQNKIEDAVTYFHYALDSAEALHDTRFICEALLNLSIAFFVQNNFNAALNSLDRLQQAAVDYCEQQQKVPCLFMQGRVALQLGESGKAEHLFKEAGALAAAHFPEWEALCSIWYGRTLSQSGQTHAAQQIFISYLNTSPDASLFLLESYLLASLFHKEYSNQPINEEALTAVLEAHKSGFALAEELVWGYAYHKPAIAIAYTVLDNYYRIKQAVQTAATPAPEHLHMLEQTAREALRCHDIYAPIYSYLCYDAFLLTEGNDSDVANGYLSRAFKALQNSTHTMTENNIRDKFIFRNVWNAKLYAAAQQNKLI